jgi:hypothetical protein
MPRQPLNPDTLLNMQSIRPENPRDQNAVRNIHEDGFSGGGEADLVDRLNTDAQFIPRLSLVANCNGELTGHILFFPVSRDYGRSGARPLPGPPWHPDSISAEGCGIGPHPAGPLGMHTARAPDCHLCRTSAVLSEVWICSCPGIRAGTSVSGTRRGFSGSGTGAGRDERDHRSGPVPGRSMGIDA